MIKPAVEGTLSVLRACTKARTIKRVVVTSSAVTFGVNGSAEQNQSIDESFWADVDSIRTENLPHSVGREPGLPHQILIPFLQHL